MARTKQKTILKTHPWITFELDLRPAPPRLWMLLGEARSKIGHLAGVPLLPDVARELHEVYLAKGVHATTAIEGNTLNEDEVLKIVQRGTTTQPQDYLEREVQNVITAANNIVDEVEKRGQKKVTPVEMKRYNALVLNRLKLDPHVVPGEISKVQVGVPGYRGAPISLCESLLADLCDWLNSPLFNRHSDDEALIYGLIKSIVAHVYLVWIHPFGDGNGRTARLLEVRFLMEAGVSSAAAHLLSNHYNQTRAEYYRQLSAASKNGGDLLPFIEYAVSGFVNQIRDQIQAVKEQLWDVSWTNYVHERFANASGKTAKRQRHLLLALSKANRPVQKKDIRNLSPRVAEEYAGMTDKTLSRDLNALDRMELIARTAAGFSARKEIILQFLPRARPGDIEAQYESTLHPFDAAEQMEFDMSPAKIVEETAP